MIVAHLDTGTTWQGGQAQVLRLMEGLRARGVTSRLMAPAGPLNDRAQAAGFDVSRWRARGDLDVAAMWRARHRLQRWQVDVVHCHTARAHAVGVPAARLAGVPAVLVSRRAAFALAGHAVSRLKYRMAVDRYVCISREATRTLATAGVPESRIVLVPSGVPLERDAAATGDRPSLRTALCLPDDSAIIGTVGALDANKNHATLLEAARTVVDELPHAHFVWLGEGEERARLERRRAALGLDGHVHLMGFVPAARSWMREFTLFVLPSRLEGLCTSLLDAQAEGIPVVATRVGGIPEIVTDGVNGRLVPPDDAAMLAREINSALAHPDRLLAWVAAGQASVTAHSVDGMVDGTLNAYRSVLAERASRVESSA